MLFQKWNFEDDFDENPVLLIVHDWTLICKLEQLSKVGWKQKLEEIRQFGLNQGVDQMARGSDVDGGTSVEAGGH